MNRHFIRLGLMTGTLIVLAGCMPAQGPQAALAVNPAEVNVSELNSYDTAALTPSDLPAVELPAEGPAVQSRPGILALASGAVSVGETLEPIVENKISAAKPEILQAMLEPQVPQLMPELELELEPEPETTVAFAKPAQPMAPSNRERDCLMRAMYFESNRSSPDGLLAVGTVVMHRVKHGAWGRSICSVVGAKRQFAPGVLTRKMQGNLKDLQTLADRIMAGKRHPKLPENVMFFHVAGMKFPYKNMRYVHVAGGNTFCYKASRKRRT